MQVFSLYFVSFFGRWFGGVAKGQKGEVLKCKSAKVLKLSRSGLPLRPVATCSFFAQVEDLSNSLVAYMFEYGQ